MKRIFIYAHSLEIGGAERSLLGLLESIDYDKYKVDLFLLRHEGELLKFLPSRVNLLPESIEYSCLGCRMVEVIKKRQYKVLFGRLYAKLKANNRCTCLGINGENNIHNEYSHKYTVDYLPNMSDDEYDLAITYMSPHYFVTKNVKAKKRLAWIHTDYTSFKVDVESELQMWNKYDYIASISERVTNSFLQTFPTLHDRIINIENMLPIQMITAQADEFDTSNEMPNNGEIKLLTIGRYSYPKRIDEIPMICSKIRSLGINLKWYIIGYGQDEDLIKRRITENNVDDSVIILGKKENPYPYIKGCDIYIQPSRYEGKSIAVREAQIMHKPVIITNYGTAHSQLNDGIDGIIVPMEVNACAERIAEIIMNKPLLNKLVENTFLNDYVGKNEIEKLYSLIED